MDAMKSLRSRGFVRETFNWQWLYYYLTDEGIEYLRACECGGQGCAINVAWRGCVLV